MKRTSDVTILGTVVYGVSISTSIFTLRLRTSLGSTQMNNQSKASKSDLPRSLEMKKIFNGCLLHGCVRKEGVVVLYLPTHWVFKRLPWVGVVPKCKANAHQPNGQIIIHCTTEDSSVYIMDFICKLNAHYFQWFCRADALSDTTLNYCTIRWGLFLLRDILA